MDENILSLLESFGDVAAEDDAVLDYFLATNAVEKIENNKTFLVLGRKGTGKTAIVRYFTEGSTKAHSKPLNLRGYPWNVHASRVDRGASEVEAYVSSWRYLIAVQLASLLLEDSAIRGSASAKSLLKFFTDNYGGPNPLLSEVLRPSRLSLGKLSLSPAVMGNQLGGVDLNRDKHDHQFGLELDALSNSILDAVRRIARERKLGLICLHFDELDQGLTELDDARSKMIIGLVLAAGEIRRESMKVGIEINPCIYLRTDIWDELQFSDKNKISQTLALNLGWTSESLQNLVEERLKAKLGPAVKWPDIAQPELMRGSQTKWNHVLARTFLRPRDVIRFLNTTLKEVKKRDDGPRTISNKDIVNSREDYSAYLVEELNDEIPQHWAQWDEALRALSAISTITFERDAFASEYDRRKSKDNNVDAAEALKYLYRFSVIGYERRSGYGGSSWAFQYTDAEAGWDNAASRFKVHLGFKEYAKLREERR